MLAPSTPSWPSAPSSPEGPRDPFSPVIPGIPCKPVSPRSPFSPVNPREPGSPSMTTIFVDVKFCFGSEVKDSLSYEVPPIRLFISFPASTKVGPEIQSKKEQYVFNERDSKLFNAVLLVGFSHP